MRSSDWLLPTICAKSLRKRPGVFRHSAFVFSVFCILFAVIFVAALGCSHNSKKSASPQQQASDGTLSDKAGTRSEPFDSDAESNTKSEDHGGMQLEGARGHITEFDVEASLAPHTKALLGCFGQVSHRHSYIGGTVVLRVFVDDDGSVAKAYPESSDVGALEVELCLVDEMKKVAFARPEGGSTDFSIPFSFPARRGHNAEWNHRPRYPRGYKRQLRNCEKKNGYVKGVLATVNVDATGVVSSVGFSSSRGVMKKKWLDCAQEVILLWDFRPEAAESSLPKTGKRKYKKKTKSDKDTSLKKERETTQQRREEKFSFRYR